MIDQYGNKTDALNAESMKAVSVSADNLDESALKFDWQVWNLAVPCVQQEEFDQLCWGFMSPDESG